MKLDNNKQTILKCIEDNNESLEGLQYEGLSNGYKIEIQRIPNLLHLCGYVYIPIDEQIIGTSYLSVHGGITYNQTESEFQCVGFDCAHFSDMTSCSNGVYWTVKEVLCELESLTKQIKQAKEL